MCGALLPLDAPAPAEGSISRRSWRFSLRSWIPPRATASRFTRSRCTDGGAASPNWGTELRRAYRCRALQPQLLDGELAQAELLDLPRDGERKRLRHLHVARCFEAREPRG